MDTGWHLRDLALGRHYYCRESTAMRREDIIGERPEYIGDGVYASVDNAGQIWLQTERITGHIEAIALDEGTFHSLIRYERRLREAFAGGRGHDE
jgi:hypothetical protein